MRCMLDTYLITKIENENALGYPMHELGMGVSITQCRLNIWLYLGCSSRTAQQTGPLPQDLRYSRLLLSRSQGTFEILRDAPTSTYQICKIDKKN